MRPFASALAVPILAAVATPQVAPEKAEYAPFVAPASKEAARALAKFALAPDLEVIEISNQSTGFCPEPESWPVVGAALDSDGATFATETVPELPVAAGLDEAAIVDALASNLGDADVVVIFRR